MKNVITHDAYKVTSRFIFQSIRNMGFTPKSCIFEFIDNSIDAGATWIKIYWKKDKFLDTYNLILEDNGCGIEKSKIMSSLATLGTPETYSPDRVGYYGVGFNASVINLMDEGEASITTTHQKETNVLKIKHELENVEFEIIGKGSNIKNKNGTQISIPNIDKKHAIKESTLIRDISVTYYPKSKNSKNFKIFVNDKEVRFIDPMYRDLSKKNVHGFTNTRVKTFKFMGNDFELKSIGFNPDIDMEKGTSKLSSWDSYDGHPKFKAKNSGFYLRLNNRYINTGMGKFPGFRWMDKMAKFRFELELPKRFIEDFGVQVNKSAAISFVEDDPNMQEFYVAVKQMCNEFANWWNKYQNKPQTSALKKKIEKINQKLNKIITDTGRMKPLVNTAGVLESGVVETRQTTKRDPNKTGVKPVKTGQTRRGRKPNKVKLPVRFDIKSDGVHNPMVDWYESDKVLNIILNSDCEWVSLFMDFPPEQQLIPILKIYSFIDTIARLGRDKDQPDEWAQEMSEIIATETDMLNKVLQD